MKVIVVGIGDLGEEVASALAADARHDVVLVEVNDPRCKAIAAKLDALVLCGDGTNPQVLQRAGLGDADALIATTGSDPVNTVVAMLGRRAGVERVLVKLTHMGLQPACDEIGVTAVVKPNIAAAARIVGALHGFQRLDFSVVARGGLRLVEVTAGKGASGKTLAAVQAPDNILVVAILRGDDVILPRGKTSLEAGDELLALVRGDHRSLLELRASLS